MFDVSNDLQTLLRSRSRNLHYVFELYPWDYVPFPESADISFDPRHAVARWAKSSLSFTWDDETIEYVRLVTDGGKAEKHIGKQFDSVSITCSNIKPDGDENPTFRYLAKFVLTHRVQGMRMVARVIPRNADTFIGSPFEHSIILFVGRCDKPDGFDRSKGTISAKQDLGTIVSQVPKAQYQPTCPHRFKHGDCLGNEALSEKSPTYQAAKICNKTEAQCIEYDNPEFFGGTKIVQLTSSFIHRPHRGLFTRIINIAIPLSIPIYNWLRRRTTVGNSIHDGTPYGQPIPIILGRWLKKLTPLQYQDTGETIWFKMAACRGTIKDFLNVRNDSPNFSQPLEIVKHLGEYGGTGTQTQDTVFPGGEFHSKLAYLTGRCIGSDIEVEDPAPDISSMVAGAVVRRAYGKNGGVIVGTGRIDNVFAGYSQDTDGWSDNPVDQAVYLITDPAILGIPMAHIGQRATARTSVYTTGAIKDVSNAERALFKADQIGKAGVEYKRYNSTGVIGALSFHGVGLEFLSQEKPGGVPGREAVYEFDTDGSIEAGTSTLPIKTVYRKRYTSNIEIAESKKAIDFLYDVIYPTFRGFTRWDQFGRLVVDCDRPADHSYLRAGAVPAATSIEVLDVTPWKPLEPLSGEPSPFKGKVLIGAHNLNSEVRPIVSASYSADGDAIEYSSSATGGLSAVSAGANLTGGSASDPSTGTVTISGTPSVGDEISITIDGYTITITATQEDVDATIPTLSLALQMVYAINAEPGLKEYVEANRGASGSSTDVTIISRLGVLNFVTPLEEEHYAEIDDPVDAPTASASAGALEAGTYLLSYAYRNANGNTNFSPILAIELADNEQIDVDAITLPADADSVDWFVSVEADSDTRLLVANNDGSAFSINVLPVSTAEHEPKRNTTGEEIMRIMFSDAQRALTYSDTARATHLDGSFTWPEGSKQSTINQVKTEHREAIQDFAKQPLVVNDEHHQEETGQVNSADIDLSAVDNHNQAVRLCNGYLAKLRDADFFFSWSSAGEVLLLEIGDVVCLSDDSGSWRNVPVRIEDIVYNDRFEATFSCRLYSTSQFDDEVLETQIPLPSALTQYMAGPEAPTDLTLAHVETSGTFDSRITGTVTPSPFLYGQRLRVYVTPPGGTEVLTQTLAPGETEFSIPAPASGDYEIRVVAVSTSGATGGEISDTITVVNAAQSLFAGSTDPYARSLAQQALGMAQQARGQSSAGGGSGSGVDITSNQAFM